MREGASSSASRQPMSQRNIALHRLVAAAVNAREAPEAILAPDFCMENRASSVTDYTYHGVTGWHDWMNDIFEEFTTGARYEVEDIIAVGDEFVVATFCIVGRSARSGMPLEFRWVGVTWFRDGRATRAVGYSTRGEALAAAGIGEIETRGDSPPQPRYESAAAPGLPW